MKNAGITILFFFCFSFDFSSQAKNGFQLLAGKPVGVYWSNTESKVVKTAIGILNQDVGRVLLAQVIHSDANSANVIICTLDNCDNKFLPHIDFSNIKDKKDAFQLQVLLNGKLLIMGSDKRGTAYGIMELSRLLGVSPWEWWADATPIHKENFTLPSGYKNCQSPSVEYRGIFINDEDFGFVPWAYQTNDTTQAKGTIGPKTLEHVFELLLRLRANTFWPAMHSCSKPFYFTQGNKETAEKYGIYIGTSHCEPMMRNANGEWHRDGSGEYDFVHNEKSVVSFWENRVKEVSHYDNIYTLGIRGIHDSKMEGANTIEEQKSALTEVLHVQRDLLRKYVNQDLAKIPQLFIPYKEVLDVYNDGLKVPDDITLVWTDDNYGYIRHFPNEAERKRSGGNGVYYHVSYWGRPHDYLWLGTTSPGLIYEQMKLAYDKNIRKIWILNVGDIKPAEYQIELFFDMAWNIHQVGKMGVLNHLKNFYQREFGSHIGEEIAPLMEEDYRLAWIRKPEFMGNTRTEETDPMYKVVKDFPWSENYIQRRLADYRGISDAVETLSQTVPNNRKSTFFQLVKYPIQAADQMNRKLLIAQLARHRKADWRFSDEAFDSIQSLTKTYNTGKWRGIMDSQPRRLVEYDKVKRETSESPFVQESLPLFRFNGIDFSRGKATLCEGLGYGEQAVLVAKNKSIEFTFPQIAKDSVLLEICLLPSHPVDGNKIRFSISVDGQAEKVFDYATKGRSEEWKENVLRNQAIRQMKVTVHKTKKHFIKFKALDEGVVLDQIKVY